jgi:hypothetical protein
MTTPYASLLVLRSPSQVEIRATLQRKKENSEEGREGEGEVVVLQIVKPSAQKECRKLRMLMLRKSWNLPYATIWRGIDPRGVTFS